MSFPNFALHATPVNRVASRVSFGESEAWEPKTGVRADGTFDFPPVAIRDRPAESLDYSGFRRGYMTAIRYHCSGLGGARWLCRCDCGKYEFRRAGKWSKNTDHMDSCQVCNATHKITHGVSIGQKPSDRVNSEKLKAQAKGGAQ